ncbi:MAG: hypothetical protein WC575_01170 [Patescibacteria group bacterium]
MADFIALMGAIPQYNSMIIILAIVIMAMGILTLSISAYFWLNRLDHNQGEILKKLK